MKVRCKNLDLNIQGDMVSIHLFPDNDKLAHKELRRTPQMSTHVFINNDKWTSRELHRTPLV